MNGIVVFLTLKEWDYSLIGCGSYCVRGKRGIFGDFPNIGLENHQISLGILGKLLEVLHILKTLLLKGSWHDKANQFHKSFELKLIV